MLRNIVSNEIFTVLLIIGLIIVTVTKLVAPKRFDDFFLVIKNSKYLKVYGKDQKFIDLFDSLLFANLMISGSIFGFLIYQFVTHDVKALSVNIMIKLVTGIGAFILIKVLLERLIGSVFEIDKIINDYLFQKITYKNFLGILLLPINALLLFSFDLTLPIISVMVILLLIINIIGLITSFKTYQSIIKSNLFYFILYLCALEITPYVILYKVFLIT